MNYNVNPETTIRHPYLASVDAIMQNEILRFYDFYRACLPQGFQTMIEIINLTEGYTDYRKGIIRSVSGSFARVKMETLRLFPNLPMTGNCTVIELIDMIRAIHPEYDVTEFSKLEDICQLTRAQHEKLRAEVGITAYLGGIRVPFTKYTSSAQLGQRTQNGEICITFSALSGESDLKACFTFFDFLQNALQKSETDTCYIFDLSELEKHQTARFIMKSYGIRPVVEK